MEVNFSKQLSDSSIKPSAPEEDATSPSSPQDSNDSPHLESEASPPSPSPPTSSSNHSSESPSSSSDSSPPPPKRSPPPDESSEAPLALPPLSSDLFEPPPPSHPHSKSPKTLPPSKSPPPPPAKSTHPPPPPLSFNPPPPPISFHHNPSPPPPSPPPQSSKSTSFSQSTAPPPSPPPPSPPPPPPTIDSNSHSPPPLSPPNNPNQSTPLPISPPPFHVPPPNASSILPSPLPNGTPNLSTPTVAPPRPNNLQKPFQSTPSTSIEAQSVTEHENPSSRPITFSNSKNSVKNFSSGAIVGVAIVGVIVLLVVILFVTSRKKRRKVDGLPNRYRPPNNFSTKAGAYYSSVGSARSNGHYAPTVSSSHSNIKHANESFRSHRYHSGSQDLVVSKSWFSYDDLMEVTSGFSRDNLLGEGGFGCVYKGHLPDGRCVAVKQLKAGSGQGEREFRAEVEIISRVHHRHLVSLVGYCIAEYHRLLVCEFVPNGTLEQHLHGDNVPIIEWSKRIKIAIGAARGLAYLHEDCHPRIIHRDIKSANILLDYTFEAQVADFGLAKLSNDTYTHVSTRVMGTFGYMAPEYASSGKLTDRSDVFSFGVVLLELITGRKPVDPSQPLGDESLVEWARPRLLRALETQDYEELVDPRMENNYAKIEMFRMIEVAAACIRHSAPKRPRMVQVVRALDFEGDGLDLSNGVKFGHSTIYDSGQYSADIQRFRRTAHGDDKHCTDYDQFGEYEKRSFAHSNGMGNSDIPLRSSSSLLSENENTSEEYYIGYNLETRPINGKASEQSDNYQ